MKRSLLKGSVFLCFTFMVFSYSNVFTNRSQPPTGNSGAPGDQTCARSGCHVGSATLDNSKFDLRQFPSLQALSNYTPGQNYTLNLNLNAFNSARYGFSLTVLDDQGNPTNAGTLDTVSIASTTTTKGSLSGRTYIGHRNAGSGTTFQFEWTAPGAGVTDSVVMYIAGNAADGNGNAGGTDKIWLGQFVFKPGQVNNCANFGINLITQGGSTVVCPGGSVTLETTVANGSGNYTYNWSTGATTSTISVTTAGTYGVTQTDVTNSCVDSGTIIISNPSLPSAGFSSSVNNLAVDFTNSSTGTNLSFNWDFGDGNTSTMLDPSNTYSNPGTYTVTLIANGDCNSADTLSQDITVGSVGVDELTGVLPVSIYPNPVQSSSRVMVETSAFTDYQFVIMDLTGRVVREKTGRANEALSVTLAEAESGIYLYQIVAENQVKGSGKLIKE